MKTHCGKCLMSFAIRKRPEHKEKIYCPECKRPFFTLISKHYKGHKHEVAKCCMDLQDYFNRPHPPLLGKDLR